MNNIENLKKAVKKKEQRLILQVCRYLGVNKIKERISDAYKYVKSVKTINFNDYKMHQVPQDQNQTLVLLGYRPEHLVGHPYTNVIGETVLNGDAILSPSKFIVPESAYINANLCVSDNINGDNMNAAKLNCDYPNSETNAKPNAAETNSAKSFAAETNSVKSFAAETNSAKSYAAEINAANLDVQLQPSSNNNLSKSSDKLKLIDSGVQLELPKSSSLSLLPVPKINFTTPVPTSSLHVPTSSLPLLSPSSTNFEGGFFLFF